jgi:hypothetical protein
VALSHPGESFLPGSTCLGFKFDPVCGSEQDSTVRCRLAFGGGAHQNYNRERDDHVGGRLVLNLNRRPHVANWYTQYAPMQSEHSVYPVVICVDMATKAGEPEADSQRHMPPQDRRSDNASVYAGLPMLAKLHSTRQDFCPYKYQAIPPLLSRQIDPPSSSLSPHQPAKPGVSLVARRP